MSVFRNKAAHLALLVTAVLGLGLDTCQMTSHSGEDQKIFQDTNK